MPSSSRPEEMTSSVAAMLATLDRRMAVMNAGDERAHPRPPGRLGERRERGPALQTRARGVGIVHRVEVVGGPAGLEYLDLVGRPPHLKHDVPGGVLR